VDRLVGLNSEAAAKAPEIVEADLSDPEAFSASTRGSEDAGRAMPRPAALRYLK
jgi:hypothetical protein